MPITRSQIALAIGLRGGDFNLLTFAMRSRFKIVVARRVMEWEPGQKKRRLKVFHTVDPRHPPDPELDPDFLKTTDALDRAVAPPHVQTALKYFRHGLLDDQPEDQFMQLWLALEIIAETLGNLVNELGALAWHAIMSAIPLPPGPGLLFGHRDFEVSHISMVTAWTLGRRSSRIRVGSVTNLFDKERDVDVHRAHRRTQPRKNANRKIIKLKGIAQRQTNIFDRPPMLLDESHRSFCRGLVPKRAIDR